MAPDDQELPRGHHEDDPAEDLIDLDHGTYERGTDEFARVLFFSDAIFAIAMTLLVAGIDVPDGPGSLAERLVDEQGQIVSFFISFIVIGYLWVAHHRLMSLVQRVGTTFIYVNLLYLALVAFLPFPTSLIGVDGDEAVAVVLYAGTLALASLVETFLYVQLHRAGNLRIVVTPPQHRQWLLASLVPVGVFLLSIPIAFWSTTAAMVTWILVFFIERAVDRFGPAAGGDGRSVVPVRRR